MFSLAITSDNLEVHYTNIITSYVATNGADVMFCDVLDTSRAL